MLVPSQMAVGSKTNPVVLTTMKNRHIIIAQEVYCRIKAKRVIRIFLTNKL